MILGLFSVEPRGRHQVYTAFYHEYLSQPFSAMQLLLRSRRPPRGQLSFCVNQNNTCSHYHQPTVQNPLTHYYVLDLGNPLDKPRADIEVKISGVGVKRLTVVGLVLLEHRKKIIPNARPQRSVGEQAPVHESPSSTSQSEICHLQNWTVQMSEVGWTSAVWPSEFQANYCTGACPLVDEMYSNHALIRQLYNEQNAGIKDPVPEACCVPWSVKPLDVLYITEDSLVARKTYADLIALACSCL